MSEGTLCAMHQTLEVGGGVLSGVRRAHLMTVFEEWPVLMASPYRSKRGRSSAAFCTPELNALGEKRYVTN